MAFSASRAASKTRAHTTDGFEAVTQINYLAPVLLTNLLLPVLEECATRVSSTSRARMPARRPSTSTICSHSGPTAGSAGPLALRDGETHDAEPSTQLHRTRKGARMGVTTNAFDPIAVHTPGYLAFNAIAKPSSGRMRFGPKSSSERCSVSSSRPSWDPSAATLRSKR